MSLCPYYVLVFASMAFVCQGAIQLPSNRNSTYIYGEALTEWTLNGTTRFKNERNYMEDEDKIYPRKWRTEELEALEKEREKNLEEEGLIVYERDGTRRPTEDVLGHFSRQNNSYLILAPLVARPSSVYRLVVLFFRAEDPSEEIDVKASLATYMGAELTFAVGKAVVGESSELMMKLPHALPGPILKLRVEAHQGMNLLFVNTTFIHPSPDFLTIVIYMARPAFNGDQQVDFRVLLMTNEMLPYQDPVDIFILDPTGYVVRRWVSRVPNTGIVELSFFTPELPIGGFWRVRVKVNSQVKDHPFLVIKYYIPRFEVMFELPSFILASEGSIAGGAEGVVTNDASSYGNMTVKLWAKYPATAPDSEYKEITTEVYDHVEGGDEFDFPMTLLDGHVPELVGTEIKITADYFEEFTGMSGSGYIKSRIISGEVSLNFVGPSPVIFRPGMPLTLSVNAAYDDMAGIDPEDLAQSSLRITASVTGGHSGPLPQIFIPPEADEGTESETYMIINNALLKNESSHSSDSNEFWLRNVRYESLLAKETYILRNKFNEYRETGIFTFTLQIPQDAIGLTVNAVYTSAEGETSGASIEGRVSYSPKQRHLHVTSSTERGVIGEYAVFHVRTNFPLEKFHYVVLSKGIVVHSSTEAVPFAGAEGVGTLGLAVSKEMFPVMTFVAYHIDSNGDLTTDSIKIPVEMQGLYKASLTINQHKDHTKKTVEVVAKAPAGTYIAVSSNREAGYLKQPINRLTKERFIMEALNLEPFQRTVAKVRRQPRNSPEAASVRLLMCGDSEGDSIRTLQTSGLASLSDAEFESSSVGLGHCEISLGLLECGDGSCYRFKDVCNGVFDCPDGIDEKECQYQYVPTNSHEEGIDEVKIYLLLRVSWWKDLFDTEDGGWAWTGQFIGHDEDEQLNLEVPKTQDDWVVEGIGAHQEFGFAFIEPQMYNSDPPIFIVLEGPSVCRRGEQISIRVAVFNSMPYAMIILLILPHSDDYQFVHVEEKGVVDAHKPRTSSGEHHHLVFMPPGETREVFIPIAVTMQKGLLEVTIRLSSQLAWDEETLEVEVKPEGAPIRKHTSVLLDLKSRAVFYEFLDIPIDESPIISNTILRRFVFGSPQAQLTISGDVFGPTSEELSVHYHEAFNGRSFKSTDGLAFNFGSTLWTLHYLRLTNQLIMSDAMNAFEFLNVQMAGLLTRFKDGGFKMWHYSGPSVWLTCWVTNLLNSAQFEDWEYLIYVDPRVITDAVKFMIEHQGPYGDFRETDYYNVTLDHKQRYQTRNFAKNVTVGLTALAGATLQQVLPSLPGKIRTTAIQAIWKARKFLEKSLPMLKDPYDIAITAWALSVVGSSEKEVAVSRLLKIMRLQDGFHYWSREKIMSNDRVFENNQRTFLLPKEPQKWDAASIEATSYALLVLLNQEGVMPRQERIVNWLVSVRDWDFAFAATVDSVVALRALTEYCYRARLRDVTDLKVEVETSANHDFKTQIRIEKPFVSIMQNLEIPNAWGHVLLTARGAGQAVAQLTMKWGVDVPVYLEKPPGDYFTLHVKEYHHQARNKSRITTTVCTSWLATDFSPTSHAAMVELEIPSGYFLHQPDANKIAREAILEGSFPEMRDALCTESFIYFQFSHIPAYEQCFEFDLFRWFPIANLTLIRSAMIFELYAPEHFEQIIINSTTLRALDICEVCGSYQCPYCHFYSSSMTLRSSLVMIIFSMVIVNEVFSCLTLGKSWTQVFYRRVFL